MSRHPCVVITLLYITGILINIPYPYPFLFISTVCFFILFSKKNKASIICLYLSIVLSGSLSSWLHSYKQASHIAHSLGERGDIIGTVIDYPRRYPEMTSFVIKTESFNGKKSTGLLYVSTKESNIFLGNRIFIHNAKINKPKVYKNPGTYNKKKYLSNRKIYCNVWTDNIISLGKGKISPFLKIASDIKTRGEKVISLLKEEERNFLLGIVLGETGGLSREIYKAFSDTGTIHILSVSGLHIALLFAFLVIVFGILGIKRPYKFVLTLPFLFLFCLVTGSSVPTVRSLIMACIFIFSIAFERESSSYNTLSIAALLLLILNPFQIYDIGFQLSFAACLFLALLTPRLAFKKGKIWMFISSCISASIGTAPLVLFWFSKLSLISPISNFFIIPIVAILLPLGLIFISVGFISISLAGLLVFPIVLLIKITTSLLLAFSSIPASSITLPSPSVCIVIFLYLFIIIFVFYLKRLFIPALLIMNILLWNEVLKCKELEATFLDVGKGDAIFIRSHNGCNILIDGGPPFAGRSCVLPFLKYKGIDRIDLLIATHSDSDHIGGLVDVLSELNVKRTFYNGKSSSSLIYKKFEKVIKEAGIVLERLKEGDRVETKDLSLEVLSPKPHLFFDDNNNSIVVKLNFRNLSFLLPGDIEDEAISFLSEMYKEELGSTILKAPHHGRNQMPSYFVNFVKPEVIIAQGFTPSLKGMISTIHYGAITIKSDKFRYKVETYTENK